MFYAFGFERLGVIVSDLYFVDPEPEEGQEGAERGVRLELRLLGSGDLHGSIYSARPINVERPLWRADLLESVAGPMGSFDRTHHHPRFDGWEPGNRVFVEDLSADPLGWVAKRLADPDGLLAEAGVAPDEVTPADTAELRAAVPQIVDAVRTLLDRIHAGELARAPGPEPVTNARISWL
ncbi:hypothetical protein [Yinghuangia sp. YIM S09857]|uniref:hypothetical protein n=1 Tax=Yinghuangia sp. YIM S09857 TaxID=3436929 RepID=UPI003F52A5F4